MKQFAGLILAITMLLPQALPAQDNEVDALRVMSFNIRYNNPGDGVNAWPNRNDQVAALIGERYQPSSVSLQEVLHGQLLDLEERLPDYDWAGVGRDDGETGGEFSCIFYRTDRLACLEDDTFWLSENPDEPGSVSWDSSMTRICTWAKFQDKQSGAIFYHFNTHYDHRGQEAREESSALIVRMIRQIAGDAPVVLTGDFNTREGSLAYKRIVGLEPVDEELANLRDARYLSGRPWQGPYATFTRENWTVVGDGSPIDYIFVNPGFSVHQFAVIDDRLENDHFPSDHLPVMADLRLAP